MCLFDDEPRSSIGDLDVASRRHSLRPPGNGYAQRGAVNAPRPNDLGTSTWTRPGVRPARPSSMIPSSSPTAPNSSTGGANSKKGPEWQLTP